MEENVLGIGKVGCSGIIRIPLVGVQLPRRGSGTPNLEVTVAVLKASMAPVPTKGFIRRPILLLDGVPSYVNNEIDNKML